MLNPDEMPWIVLKSSPVVPLVASQLFLGLPVEPLDQIGQVIGLIMQSDCFSAELTTTDHYDTFRTVIIVIISLTGEVLVGVTLIMFRD